MADVEGPGSGQPDGPERSLPPRLAWWDDLVRLGHAYKHLFAAQLQLLTAELGLARSAVHWMLAMALLATISGVGLGLTLLGALGVLLAQWLGSPLRALLVLALLQMLALGGAVWLFIRCMHWMSLPRSRGEWRALVSDTLRKTKRRIDDEESP
ncbi:ABC transporter ATP-binding protein [Frateuria aurantia]